MSRVMLISRLTCLAGASDADLQADVLWGAPSVRRMEETFVSWSSGVVDYRQASIFDYKLL
jgi:hypothetical protein